nr:MAG TPA: hypothetical protein [Caudoviricetes sp.]
MTKIFYLVSLNKDLKNDKYQLLKFLKTTTNLTISK